MTDLSPALRHLSFEVRMLAHALQIDAVGENEVPGVSFEQARAYLSKAHPLSNEDLDGLARLSRALSLLAEERRRAVPNPDPDFGPLRYDRSEASHRILGTYRFEGTDYEICFDDQITITDSARRSLGELSSMVNADAVRQGIGTDLWKLYEEVWRDDSDPAAPKTRADFIARFRCDGISVTADGTVSLGFCSQGSPEIFGGRSITIRRHRDGAIGSEF